MGAHPVLRHHKSMPLVDVNPAKLVEVWVDGRWYPGELRAWQKLDGRWRGDVTYTIGVGMRKLGGSTRNSFGVGFLTPQTRLRRPTPGEE